jgi:hypothetical protein
VANPVTYANQPLSRRLAEASPVLVLPDFVTFVPCARQPSLEDGMVGVPRFILTPFEGTSWLSSWETSPFEGLLDIYPPERVSGADSPDRRPSSQFWRWTRGSRAPRSLPRRAR